MKRESQHTRCTQASFLKCVVHTLPAPFSSPALLASRCPPSPLRRLRAVLVGRFFLCRCWAWRGSVRSSSFLGVVVVCYGYALRGTSCLSSCLSSCMFPQSHLVVAGGFALFYGNGISISDKTISNIGEEFAHLRRSEEDLGSEVVFWMGDEWSFGFGLTGKLTLTTTSSIPKKFLVGSKRTWDLKLSLAIFFDTRTAFCRTMLFLRSTCPYSSMAECQWHFQHQRRVSVSPDSTVPISHSQNDVIRIRNKVRRGVRPVERRSPISRVIRHLGVSYASLLVVVGLKRTWGQKLSSDLLLTFMTVHLFQFCFADAEQSCLFTLTSPRSHLASASNHTRTFRQLIGVDRGVCISS